MSLPQKSSIPPLLEILEKSSFITFESDDQRDSLNSSLLKEWIESEKDLETILTEKKLVTAAEIALAQRSLEMGIDCVNLDVADPEPEALATMTAGFAYKNRIVPLRYEEDVLSVAMHDPFDIILLDEIRLVTQCEIQPLLADEAEIGDAVRRLYGKTAEDIIAGQIAGPAGIVARGGIETIRDYGLDDETLAHDPTVLEAVNQLIIDAVRKNASDIHVEPFAEAIKIRFRIDGVLEDQPAPPRHLQAALISRIKIMSDMDIAQRRLPQDGKIPLRIATLNNRDIDIRVSTVPTVHGESVVLRILDKQSISYGLEQLGLMEESHEQFQRMIRKPHGIILATGPTGSGKTTTLYACLKEINTSEVKIITVEEPVEYDLPGINQMNAHPEIGFTFAAALRHILRQDPDKVLVGEIRDFETAEMAIHTALTGHLVFSTLHTNDAPSAITRLIDMGIEPFLVASTIEGIIAQRLARRVCSYCVEFYRPEPEVLLDMHIDPGTVDKDLEVPRAVGCKECRGRGYRGRIGLFEVITMVPTVREMCIKGITSSAIRQEAMKSAGMHSLRENGWQKIMAGYTTVEEVLRLTPEAEFEFEQIEM